MQVSFESIKSTIATMIDAITCDDGYRYFKQAWDIGNEGEAKTVALTKKDTDTCGILNALFQRVCARHSELLKQVDARAVMEFRNNSAEFLSKLDAVKAALRSPQAAKSRVAYSLEYVGDLRKTTYFRVIATDKQTKKVAYEFSLYNTN